MRLSDMEPREKRVLAAGALVVLAMAVYLLASSGGESEAPDKRAALRAKQEFEENLNAYKRLEPTIKLVERKLKSTPPDYDLYGELSNHVAELGLNTAISSMKRHESNSNDYYSESYVDMDLKKIKLDDLVGLLKKIDSSQAFLRVDRLLVNRRFSEKGELDVSMRVVAYSPPSEVENE